ncbi:MAG TPA: LysR substrate-binding domain-containing protein [Solirubrobacteraceae bacterium]|jgi:DNA-binding transcriptional LysR family regulator|nr:LysR substrate-binding domain-containing protein [Solirubrobacteraceae bacterium]
MDEHHHFIAGLTAFVGVEGARSLADAEGRSGLPSKSSISTHLKQFNKLLGCDVTGAGVKYTDAGKRIQEEAKRLLEDLDQSFHRAHRHLQRVAQTSHPVGIAMSPTVWTWARTKSEMPLVQHVAGQPAAEFLLANSSRVQTVVREGLFEIGITLGACGTGLTEGPYDAESVGTDEIVVLVPPDHAWSAHQHVVAENLSSTPLIALDVSANAREVVDAAMEAVGLELAPPLEEAATAELALQEALAAGVPALVPEIVLSTDEGREAESKGFKRLRVNDLALTREFVLIYQAPNMLRPEAREILGALRKMLQSADASKAARPLRARR